MKKIVSFFLLLCLVSPLWAAESIKGLVVDAADQSPLDYVNITLFKDGSIKPITLVSTDTNGAFILPTIENGKYNQQGVPIESTHLESHSVKAVRLHVQR